MIPHLLVVSAVEEEYKEAKPAVHDRKYGIVVHVLLVHGQGTCSKWYNGIVVSVRKYAARVPAMYGK